jgi:phosphoribosylformimino-5-aminoimidazole carboxamide ribotide isomerase
MVNKYKEKIAVGVDIKNRHVAIKGWTEVSDKDAHAFCISLQELGVKTIICTDISKDGILTGTNVGLYKTLKNELDINIIASGGVSTLEDIEKLSKLDIHGAIIGKALYTGDINLTEAIRSANT